VGVATTTGKNKSGEERQVFATVQYSLTTQQFTVAFGGTEQYTFALSDTLQATFWVQLQAGRNINARSTQEQLTAGAQFVWQPNDWFSIGAQYGLGPTLQSAGPNSVDRQGLIFFQVQK
jgi:hypothetical protein